MPLLPTYFLLSRLQPPSPLHVLLTIFLTFIVFYATLVISIVLYRVSPFHPLAKFPGPRLAKISQLWAAVVTSGGKRHKRFKKLHDQYGPYVRVGASQLGAWNMVIYTHYSPRRSQRIILCGYEGNTSYSRTERPSKGSKYVAFVQMNS